MKYYGSFRTVYLCKKCNLKFVLISVLNKDGLWLFNELSVIRENELSVIRENRENFYAAGKHRDCGGDISQQMSVFGDIVLCA